MISPRFLFFVWGTIALIVLGGVIGAAFLLKSGPEVWRAVAKDYQTIFASFGAIFAALLALAGAFGTIYVQGRNVERQITEQQKSAERVRALRRQQLASGFIAEIELIVSAFRDDVWLEVIDEALTVLQPQFNSSIIPGRTHITIAVSRPPDDYAVFYRANVSEVGQFPNPVPEHLITFYGMFLQLRDNLARVANASDENFAHMQIGSVVTALRDQRRLIEGLTRLGPQVAKELKPMRDQ